MTCKYSCMYVYSEDASVHVLVLFSCMQVVWHFIPKDDIEGHTNSDKDHPNNGQRMCCICTIVYCVGSLPECCTVSSRVHPAPLPALQVVCLY